MAALHPRVLGELDRLVVGLSRGSMVRCIMTLTLSIPIVTALVGLGLYGFTQNKLQEVGRILFAVGSLAALLHLRT